MTDLVSTMRSRPAAIARAADKILAERSLLEFIRQMWEVLEPGRQFVEGWAVGAICEHLEAVTSGEIKRLLINVPPGCMKSLTTSVFWPAWEWGPKGRPETRYVAASYADSLTLRDNRKFRMLVQSEQFRAAWPGIALSQDQNEKRLIGNTATGFKLATSVGGVGTGERGDRVIVDDPHNVKEGESEVKREAALQWFTEVMPTRVNDPSTSATIVIMQRVHDRDVSGLIIAKELGYEHLCLPMEYEEDHPHPTHTSIGFADPRWQDGELLWPERFSKSYVDDELVPALSAWGGSYAVAGQLQQRPSPRGGGDFKRVWFEIVESAPHCHRVVRGWDFAASKKKGAAYTASTKMGMTAVGQLVIFDVRRARLSPHGVESELVEMAHSDGLACAQSIPQDPGQAGKAQVARLVSLLQGYTAHASPETGSKEDRARPLAAQAEAGNVLLVRAPWNDTFLAEAEMFPSGAYKDQIDSASRAHSWLIQRRPRRVGGAPETVKG